MNGENVMLSVCKRGDEESERMSCEAMVHAQLLLLINKSSVSVGFGN